MKNNRFIKNIFLYQVFQKKLISFIVLIYFFVLVSFYLGISKFFALFIAKGRELGIPEYHAFYKFIEHLRNEMDFIFIITTLVSLVVIIIGAYYISHKVAGPLYRLRKELIEMNHAKDFKKIYFRKNDYLLDVQKEFNQLVDLIKQKDINE